MAAVFTEFLLVAILCILGSLAVSDRYLLDKTDISRSELYGFGFLVIGLVGIASTPMIFIELESPLYTIATLVLSVGSSLFGWTESKTGKIESLPSITTITLFTISSYFLAVSIPPVRKFLIETVTAQTTSVLSMWYEVHIMEGPEYGYLSQIVFLRTDPTLITYIDIACTGIGSIALVWGIISVFRTTIKRRVVYMILAAGVIYVLNLVRNIFIAVAFVEQWFNHPVLSWLALASGADGDKLVSFVVAETFISQFISAGLLFIGLYVVVTYTTLLEDVFTRFEDDLDIVIDTVEEAVENYRSD